MIHAYYGWSFKDLWREAGKPYFSLLLRKIFVQWDSTILLPFIIISGAPIAALYWFIEYKQLLIPKPYRSLLQWHLKNIYNLIYLLRKYSAFYFYSASAFLVLDAYTYTTYLCTSFSFDNLFIYCPVLWSLMKFCNR